MPAGHADRGRRQSQYQIVGGENSQCAARVEGSECLAARPVLRRDQDSGDQEPRITKNSETP